MRTDRHYLKKTSFLILRPTDSRLRKTVVRNVVLSKPGKQYFNSTTIKKKKFPSYNVTKM